MQFFTNFLIWTSWFLKNQQNWTKPDFSFSTGMVMYQRLSLTLMGDLPSSWVIQYRVLFQKNKIKSSSHISSIGFSSFFLKYLQDCYKITVNLPAKAWIFIIYCNLTNAIHSTTFWRGQTENRLEHISPSYAIQISRRNILPSEHDSSIRN
jgi:hypothetical protein